MGAVEDVVARLTAQMPSRTIYPYAVPDGSLPGRYLVVYGSEGSEESTRSTFTVSVQTPSVWVSCVSRNASPLVAAREASRDARDARTALRNYSPEGTWAFRSEASQPARRDESVTATTYVAVEQFSRRTNL